MFIFFFRMQEQRLSPRCLLLASKLKRQWTRDCRTNHVTYRYLVVLITMWISSFFQNVFWLKRLRITEHSWDKCTRIYHSHQNERSNYVAQNTICMLYFNGCISAPNESRLKVKELERWIHTKCESRPLVLQKRNGCIFENNTCKVSLLTLKSVLNLCFHQ